VSAEKDDFRGFFQGLSVKETWNEAEMEAEVTYIHDGSEFKFAWLHYHLENLWLTTLHKVVRRCVLDYTEHDWPYGFDNTDKIIQDMVNQCDGEKDACLLFLRGLRGNVFSALAQGMPGRYWPNILNNNHWHDVANFIKLCVEQPNDAADLANQCQQGKDVYPLNRLVFRWLPEDDRDKGIYKGVYRCAFHGKYQMTRNLLGLASPAKTRSLRKYPSGGEGKDHRELKEHFAKHPEGLGLDDIVRREMEYGFISGDSADLVFWHTSGEITVVEIETNNPDPGAYQLIKYRALLCAEDGLSLVSPKVHAILVAWSVPLETRRFCQKYGIHCQEHKLPM
jgi:hypothetical protein